MSIFINQINNTADFSGLKSALKLGYNKLTRAELVNIANTSRGRTKKAAIAVLNERRIAKETGDKLTNIQLKNSIPNQPGTKQVPDNSDGYTDVTLYKDMNRSQKDYFKYLTGKDADRSSALGFGSGIMEEALPTKPYSYATDSYLNYSKKNKNSYRSAVRAYETRSNVLDVYNNHLHLNRDPDAARRVATKYIKSFRKQPSSSPSRLPR